MELSQSHAFKTAQGRKVTHDFLSLCSHSSVRLQDTRPTHGGFLKTHNFLQPSEVEEKNAHQEDNSADINFEKPPPAAQHPSTVEQVFPGGIGTFTISHSWNLNQRLPKSEENVFTIASVPGNDRNGENPTFSPYTGSEFTLWDESVARKRNSRKEKLRDINVVKEPTLKEGQWPSDQPTQLSSNHRSSASPFSSSQAPLQKSQSFMEMINSAKTSNSMEEDEESLSLKKESSSTQNGELRLKVDGRSSDQRPNTPRSRHSATEQRRRCKINDRFQKLRGLIPHSDQKRDKASFLLEVIGYIQFLQEKVNRYEGSYPGWNSEPTKLIPWRNHLGPSKSLADQPRDVNSVASPMLVFGAKLDEEAAVASSNIRRNTQIPEAPNASSTIDLKTVDQQSGMTYKAVSNLLPLQSEVYEPYSNNCAENRPSTMLSSEADDASLAQPQLRKSRMPASESVAAADALKDQEPALESGTFSISKIYSEGLLNTLTRALQSSGVDLSQASISVQVDIGKQANDMNHGPDAAEKKLAEAPSCNQSSRDESPSLQSDCVVKRLKTI